MTDDYAQKILDEIEVEQNRIKQNANQLLKEVKEKIK